VSDAAKRVLTDRKAGEQWGPSPLHFVVVPGKVALRDQPRLMALGARDLRPR
jgi:hypothetical protein